MTIDYSKFKDVDKAFRHLPVNQGLMDDVSSGFSSLRFKGKAWNLQFGGKNYFLRRADDDTPLSYVDVIIIGISPYTSRVYFGEWNEDSASGPICASLKGDVPDPGVAIKQSDRCDNCQRAEWYTRPDGTRKPDCQQYKKLAVLLMPEMTANLLPMPMLDPVFLKIPPASRKTLKNYYEELEYQGIPFASVVTRVSFSPDKQFEMKFEPVKKVTGADGPLVLQKMNDPQTLRILGQQGDIRQLPPRRPIAELPPATSFAREPGPAEIDPEPQTSKRGRPAGGKNKPKPVELDIDTPAHSATMKDEAEHIETTTEEPEFRESDDVVDNSISKLVSKMGNLLK